MSGFDKKQKATVSVAVITSFITTFTGSALNLSIPALNQEFAVSAAADGLTPRNMRDCDQTARHGILFLPVVNRL